jgi:enamine deaminase RidA (YjgF/YER057c/UK114 family)
MPPLVHPVETAAVPRSVAFAPAMLHTGGPTVYVGGQNGVDSEGRMADGLAGQTRQAMRNLLAVLDAAGTGPQHVVKLTIYLVAGADLRAGYAASAEVWGDHRTAITVLLVAGLARPDALVEVDAIAAIPQHALIQPATA